LWIPRSSLEELDVVAVIGAAKRKVVVPVAKDGTAAAVAQEELFGK
jgi:hypothetical protein